MAAPIEVDEQYQSHPSDNDDDPDTTTQDDSQLISSEQDVGSGSGDSRHSTTSLKSATPEPILENGRLYANETYFMPCDEAEQTRLSILYQIYLYILDDNITLGRIPPHARRILDIGTGTGDWALAAAERFPEAEITATEIAPTLPPTTLPANLTILHDSALTTPWIPPSPTDGYDYIHLRSLSGAFPSFHPIYTAAFSTLAPGGTLEVSDTGPITLTHPPSQHSYLDIYNGALETAARARGVEWGVGHLRKAVFEAAGLRVLKERVVDVPVGVCAGEREARRVVVGKMALVVCGEGLEAGGLRLLTGQGWGVGEVRELCGKVMGEILAPGAKPFMKVHFVVARKLAY